MAGVGVGVGVRLGEEEEGISTGELDATDELEATELDDRTIEDDAAVEDSANEEALRLDRLWLEELMVAVEEAATELLATGVLPQTLSRVDPKPVDTVEVEL